MGEKGENEGVAGGKETSGQEGEERWIKITGKTR